MTNISIPGNWQTCDVEAMDGDFDDNMLQFLGSFEEVLPEGVEVETKKGMKKKVSYSKNVIFTNSSKINLGLLFF